jgi:carbonic anhydrase
MRKMNKALIQRLTEGNRRYCLNSDREGREQTALHGQKPWAIVVACSDSRVIPEEIFDVSLGELFVIRVAGNVLDNHQLGSIEYAAAHLGCGLVIVLGHTRCGAVDAAMHHDPDGYIRFITDEIADAIADEQDEAQACRLNALHSVRRIEESLEIRHQEDEGLRVCAALYHVDTGAVEFL